MWRQSLTTAVWMVTGSFNIGGYTTGSSILSLGLNVWQAMLVVIIGHSLVACVCLGTGMPWVCFRQRVSGVAEMTEAQNGISVFPFYSGPHGASGDQCV